MKTIDEKIVNDEGVQAKDQEAIKVWLHCRNEQGIIMKKGIWLRYVEAMKEIHRFLPYRKAAVEWKPKPANASEGRDWPKVKINVFDMEEESMDMPMAEIEKLNIDEASVKELGGNSIVNYESDGE
ncbi:hypothetical protein AMTRI_Chr07g27680 [Amborella trichopoda]